MEQPALEPGLAVIGWHTQHDGARLYFNGVRWFQPETGPVQVLRTVPRRNGETLLIVCLGILFFPIFIFLAIPRREWVEEQRPTGRLIVLCEATPEQNALARAEAGLPPEPEQKALAG